MEFLAIFAFCAACVFVLIVVHEFGHYLAGIIAGISMRDVRIRLLRLPQHVELRDGSEWVSPLSDIQRYVDTVWRYLKTRSRVYAYVCGGLVLETMFTVGASMALIAVDRPRIALALAGLSLMMLLPWLIIDGINICRGRVGGDLSGLWLLARFPTIVLLVIFVAVRVAILWHVAD